ncbi:MAG: hypothetical protein ACK51J_05060 [Burkholderiales bacterium]|nr:hypothetical protein [Betaproteobacteria bacterium]
MTFPDGTSRSYVYAEAANIALRPTDPLFPTLLTGVVNENGTRLSTFKYDASGRAYSTEWAGGVNKYVANSTSETNPLGRTKTFSLTTINGVKTFYDVVHPSATTSYTGSVTESFRHDVNGNLTSYTDLRGIVTTRVFDTIRNLETSRTESSNSLPRTVTTSWHPTLRLPASITEPVRINGVNGTKTTSFSYDANGNLTQRVVTTPSGTRTWAWTYNANGQVLTAADPMNRTTTNTYYPNTAAQNTALPNSRGMLATTTNPLGQTTSITNYNSHGQPTRIVDANGFITELLYDLRKRLVSRTVQGEVTQYQYDNVGQLTRVTLPDGSYVSYLYDAAQRLFRMQDGPGNFIQYTLDNAGNRIGESVYDKTGALARSRSRVFDDLSRMIREIGGASPSTQITQYAYDANGNKYAESNPNGVGAYYTYDGLDRLTQITNQNSPSDVITKFEYDLQNNLTKVTDPKNLATSYSYNGFNELVSQVSPDTGSTSFTYDAAGNMLTKTDARGVTFTYTYDALNRVTAISFPPYQTDPAEQVVYTYDTCTNGKGRLCSLSDKTGTTSYSYNAKGRVVAKSQNVGSLTQTVTYAYNNVGQLTGIVYPSGTSVSYGYLNNRITSLTVNGKSVLREADYEPFGQVGEWLWGNSTTLAPNRYTRYFDLDGRNTKIEYVAGMQPTTILYDAASRITSLQTLTATGAAVDTTKSFSYGYDSLDRLTSMSPGVGNAVGAQGFSYDATGNRLSQTVGTATTQYQYGSSSHRLNSLTGATNKTITHDSVGNRVGDGTGTWIYGGNNRPISVTTGGVTTSFQINALGQRVRKATSGTGVRFVYDEDGRLLGEYTDSGSRITETIWFNDIPVAVQK